MYSIAAALAVLSAFRYLVCSARSFVRTAQTYSLEAFVSHFARAFSSKRDTNESSFIFNAEEIFGAEGWGLAGPPDVEEEFPFEVFPVDADPCDDVGLDLVSFAGTISISTVIADLNFPSELTDSTTYWCVPVLKTLGYHERL